jgi:microcystin-dependent protein
MMRRICATLLALHLAIIPTHVFASQNSLTSPSTGTVSGLQLTNSYNNALDSVNTMNSGASAPTNQLSGFPSLGNWWLNTTTVPYPAQVYDGADWLTPFWIDASNHYTDVKIGGGVATLASAATVDLCNGVPQAYITVSGTTSITSFGSTCNAGHIKTVTFSGILTLTYNATSLIIPGAANVVTAAGDQAIVVSLGSGNWQVLAYTPASGTALINPSVDIGDIIFTAALAAPSAKYLFAYGQAISRTTYATYLTAITSTQSVTRTNGSPTLTGFSDTTQIANGGAAVEGSGIATGAYIVSCTSTTCTMSANATSSGTANVTVFPYGNGNGSTTFNMPNCQGVALVGRDNMSGSARGALTSTYYGVNPDSLGAYGGAQSQTLAQVNLPILNFNISGISVSNPALLVGASPANGCNIASSGHCTAGGGTAFAVSTTADNDFTIASNVAVISQGVASSGGSGTAQANVQPSLTVNCMVRVLAFLDPALAPPTNPLAPGLAANDNLVAIERRFAA